MKKLLPLTLSALFLLSSCKSNSPEIEISSTPPVNDITVSEVAAESTTAPKKTIGETETAISTEASQTEITETEQTTITTLESVISETETETSLTETETTTVSEAEVIETEVTVEELKEVKEIAFLRLEEKYMWGGRVVILGRYVNMNGKIKEFEIMLNEDQRLELLFGYERDVSYLENYIIDNYDYFFSIAVDTGEIINENELAKYYAMFLTMGEEPLVSLYPEEVIIIPAEDLGIRVVYGIKRNSDNDIEVVFLEDMGNAMLIKEHPNTQEIFDWFY